LKQNSVLISIRFWQQTKPDPILMAHVPDLMTQEPEDGKRKMELIYDAGLWGVIYIWRL